jgi:hypothetical protein
VEQRPKKLLEQVSDVNRLKHYSYKTEKSYISWIKRYVLSDDKRHPKEMGSAEIEAFLTHLTVEEHFAGLTQNQAQNAVVFLCRIPRKGFLGNG